MPVREAMGLTKAGRSNLPWYEKMSNSEDFIEGPKAFAEKRDPVWKRPNARRHPTQGMTECAPATG